MGQVRKPEVCGQAPFEMGSQHRNHLFVLLLLHFDLTQLHSEGGQGASIRINTLPDAHGWWRSQSGHRRPGRRPGAARGNDRLPCYFRMIGEAGPLLNNDYKYLK